MVAGRSFGMPPILLSAVCTAVPHEVHISLPYGVMRQTIGNLPTFGSYLELSSQVADAIEELPLRLFPAGYGGETAAIRVP